MDNNSTTEHPGASLGDAYADATAVLEGVSGSAEGQHYELLARHTVVGKSDAVEISLSDTGVSRRHAKLVITADNAVTVYDLASTNGTFVNDARIEMAPLRRGDVVRFGPLASCRLQYRQSERVTGPVATPEALSARQFEVAKLAARGLTIADVAKKLGISPRTVKSHIDAIYSRLGIGSRAELATWLARQG